MDIPAWAFYAVVALIFLGVILSIVLFFQGGSAVLLASILGFFRGL